MTPLEQVFDRLTGGRLTRLTDERDAARRTVHVLCGRVGADIPIEDHIDAVNLVGAILARFAAADDTRAPTARAHVGTSVLQRWRDEHQRLRAHITADRQLTHHAERQRAGATDV